MNMFAVDNPFQYTELSALSPHCRCCGNTSMQQRKDRHYERRSSPLAPDACLENHIRYYALTWIPLVSSALFVSDYNSGTLVEIWKGMVVTRHSRSLSC